MRGDRFPRFALLALLVGALSAPHPLFGQEIVGVEGRRETGFAPQSGVSPGGAFVRALLLPGWGHVAAGVPERGAFYLVAQGVSLFSLQKSIGRRVDAEESLGLRRRSLEERLRLDGVDDPAAIRAAMLAAPGIREGEARLASRDQQVEDWTAVSIFFLLLSAADAYVSAHLRSYPEPLRIEASPAPMGGGEVRIILPWPGLP